MDTGPVHDEKPTGSDGCDDGLVSRRRFARAGLTGSVLLGSLASKPVLGAASVGCTVSGQMSGNLSREALTFNCDVGRGPAEWLPTSPWPSPFSRGGLPNNMCNFAGGPNAPGTFFNGWTPPSGGVPALINAFFRVPSGPPMPSCTVALSGGTLPASMRQVLNTASGDPKFQLGRAVVASLLNIASVGPDYPVTYHTVIAMFNATFNGGNYVVGSVTWNRARVIAYLESLYQPSP